MCRWKSASRCALEPGISAEVFARGNKAVKDFLSYLEILVEGRRAKPGNPERDVLTRLIQGEDNGERLTEKELLHNCIFLLNAGHETTTNLIGNALVALTAHPAQKKRLIENPAMIKTADEEILRLESSNQLGNRMTAEPVELGGITLAAGTPVTLCIGAANRDPKQFSDPETLDIGRTPNRHLAFGTGAHQCAGIALARLEGAIAISRFLARFPHYALNGPPVRGGRVRFRGFLSVPCAVAEGRPAIKIPCGPALLFNTRRHPMATTTGTTAQPGAAIPPDDASRKLTVADPDDPKLRHVSVAGGTYTILVSGEQTGGPERPRDILG